MLGLTVPAGAATTDAAAQEPVPAQNVEHALQLIAEEDCEKVPLIKCYYCPGGHIYCISAASGSTPAAGAR